MIIKDIDNLIAYAVATNLIDPLDIIYIRNRLFEALCLTGITNSDNNNSNDNKIDKDNKTFDTDYTKSPGYLSSILKNITDYAIEKNLCVDTQGGRDLFDTKIMGLLTPAPSVINKKFWNLYKISPDAATNWFYEFSQNTNYIRRDRIARDKKWQVQTPYGTLDITINLSKPEKDPRDIARALKVTGVTYPKCPICRENEGFNGSPTQAARQNHRLILLNNNDINFDTVFNNNPCEQNDLQKSLNQSTKLPEEQNTYSKVTGDSATKVTNKKTSWFLQYSPYVYYNEHCIVLSSEHSPMKICHETFVRLLDFVTMFPHYTLGSNADLPIVGGSILTHDHYQGGCYEFPMARAPVERTFKIAGVNAGVVKWPMSVIRLSGYNKKEIIFAADKILNKWRAYNDESVGIFSNTDNTPHNTITPIARCKNIHQDNSPSHTLPNCKTNGQVNNGLFYELDLVLRNNITTEQHPLGVFHPHKNLHHIKKENIGLIEVLGLAILPGRLKSEMATLADCLIKGIDPATVDSIAYHADWATTLPNMQGKQIDEVNLMLNNALGQVFLEVLNDAGVFKRDAMGQTAFDKFLLSVDN